MIVTISKLVRGFDNGRTGGTIEFDKFPEMYLILENFNTKK